MNKVHHHLMNRVYFRNSPGSTELHISFRYKNPTFNVDREFNFCRNMNESIDDALVRIRTSMEKKLNEKFIKNQKEIKSSQENLAVLAEPAEPASKVLKVVVDFIRNDEKLTSIRFAKMLENTDGLILQVLDDKFDVVLNAPWVCHVRLPHMILSGCIIYPIQVKLQFAERKYSTGTWYKGNWNIQELQWTKCGSGFSYQTTKKDIYHMIKFELQPGNATNLGPVAEVIGNKVVERFHMRCPFEDRQVFTQNCLKGDQFRVISYNILADLYADTYADINELYKFLYCDPRALLIAYRRQLFIKEILGYNGDVVCLQEVDVKVFDLDLQPLLDEKGYAGLMQQKGSVGIATFYRTDRFELVRSSDILIGDNIKTLPIFRSVWEKIQNNTKLAKRISEIATTLQLTILKSKDTNKYLLVANTHLYIHSKADHIRLLQAGLSMLYIENIYKQLANELEVSENDICLIFCGDFNSVPECGIYKLMTEKFVGSDFIDWNSNAEEAIKDVSLAQPFSIASACGTPKYTILTDDVAACFDYIFYQADRLSVEQVIPLPSEEELRKHKFMPSVVFPSDHLALVADLKFKQ